MKYIKKYKVSAHNYCDIFPTWNGFTNLFIKAVWMFYKAIIKYEHVVFEVRK